MSDHSITSLIEKLEVAEGPSQELSARVIHAVRAPDGAVEQSRINGRWCVYDKNGRLLESGSRNGWWREGGWEVTESLDAALALAGRVVGEEAALSILQDTVDGWNAAAGLSIRNLPRLFCAAVLRAQSEARV